jgi:hypothetical protein
MLIVISHISLFSQFADLQDSAVAVVQNHAFGRPFWTFFRSIYPGLISKSQPTFRGHTPARCLPHGWRRAAAPSNPAKAKRQKP